MLRYPYASLLVLSFLAACGNTHKTTPPSDGPVLDTSDPLRHVANCAELEQALKADVRTRLQRSFERADGSSGGTGGVIDGGTDGGSGGNGVGGTGVGGTGGGTAGGGGDDGGVGGSGSTGSESNSTTNTQVDGIDEADFIKNDGEWIYVVRDRKLYVSQAWPVTELALKATAEIEGLPFEMFVVESDQQAGLSGERKVVVYSMVDGTDVYRRAGVTPPSEGGVGGFGGSVVVDGQGGTGGLIDDPGTEVGGSGGAGDTGGFGAGGTAGDCDSGSGGVAGSSGTAGVGGDVGVGGVGGTAGDGAGGSTGGTAGSAPVQALTQTGTGGADGSDPSTFGQPPYQYWTPNALVKVTVLVGAPDALQVTDAFYLQGSYVSARRNGQIVRTALQLTQPYIGLKTYLDEADQKKAELVLVTRLINSGRNVEDIPADELARLYAEVAAELLLEQNESVIENLDYKDWLPLTFHEEQGKMQASPVACDDFYLPPPAASDGSLTQVSQIDLENLSTSSLAVLARTDTLYENNESFVLAAGGSQVVDGAWSQEPVTYVHWFGVNDSNQLKYRASGVVPGYVDGQFAIDEADGALRVTSTTGGWSTQASTFVSVLEPSEQLLEIVGQAGPLAPGEQVYSVRYVGDIAYIVTFRQVDPLFVVDVKNPTRPKLLGELHIPGFSEYMHPLDAGHLLTVGRDGDADGNVGNVALQIFDVSDPLAPKLAHKFVFDEFGNSEGLMTHKAVTYFAEQQLLALPFSSDYWTSSSASSLELFHVDAATGFEHRGGLSGTKLLSSVEQTASADYYCDPWYVGLAGQLRRGVFIDDVVYGVGYKGIVAANVSSPETSLAILPFDSQDQVPNYCYLTGTGGTCGTGGLGGEGGTAGTGMGGAGGESGTSGSAGTGMGGAGAEGGTSGSAGSTAGTGMGGSADPGTGGAGGAGAR